jgi:myo-inositol 2-dehydrogenase/D-chiro-inositol 1-dehydrogenase
MDTKPVPIKDKIKSGIIGFGKRGIMHASMVNMNPRAEWMATCIAEEQSLNYLKHFYPNTPFFLDVGTMLERVPLDTVFICTPDDTHLSLTTELSKRDMNIFIEKPLAESLASGKKMVDLISSKNNVYSIGYYSLFKLLFQKAKALLDDGILDKIKRYRASLYYSLPRSSPSIDKIIREKASSFLHLIRWFFGPVKTLYAKAPGKIATTQSGISSIMDHSSGLVGIVDMSWSRPGYPLPAVKITVEATGGTLEISDDNLKIYLYRKKGTFEKGWTIIHSADLPSPSRFFLCEEGYYEGNSSFINSCLDRDKASIPWEEGLEIVRMIEAADLSIESNREITLSEVK